MHCDIAWSLIVQSSKSIFIHGRVHHVRSWLPYYDQTCVKDNSCLQRLVNICHVGKSYFNHIVIIGANEVTTPAISEQVNSIEYTKDNPQATACPWWTTTATYFENAYDLDPTNGSFPIKKVWVAFGDSYAVGIGAGTELKPRQIFYVTAFHWAKVSWCCSGGLSAIFGPLHKKTLILESVFKAAV